MSQPAPLRVRHSGPAAIIDLEGDLDHLSEGPLLNALHGPQVGSRRCVLLNFERVGYINSAGISLLVSLISETRQSDRVLAVTGLSPHYRKIFRMVGLHTFLRIFESEQEALQSVACSGS